MPCVKKREVYLNLSTSASKSVSYQYESWYEGGGARQSHVKLGRQGVQKHAYCGEDIKKKNRELELTPELKQNKLYSSLNF